MKSFFAASALIAAVAAQTGYTPPKTQDFGSLLTPNGQDPITTGQVNTITWVNTAGADATVSLVLCNGPGANCVLQQNAIASNIPAGAQSYSWSAPCSLPAGTASTSTGYGMLIIVDGTGSFQYSTQFSVIPGSSCGSSGSTTTTSSSSTSGSSTSTISSSSSSISGKPTGYTTTSGWYSWTSANATTPAPTAASTKYTSAWTTSQAVSATSTKTAAASTYTGAAAMPSAFINAAGLIGAAGLAMFAL